MKGKLAIDLKDIKKKVESVEYSKTEKFGQFMKKTGDVVMEGISLAGEGIGKGIRESSKFLKGLFKKNEKETQISEKNMARFRTVNKTAGAITEFTVA